MNKRKILGTIIGIMFWSFCVVFFTYAYYDWKSVHTNVVFGIEDLSVECLVGANVEATNIGPVLNYQDGVKLEFSINNMMADNMAIELYLDITSISDNLFTESLKYVLVADSTGGTNYDYDNPIIEGDFSNFIVGNNLITNDLELASDVTTNYQFIIYIDGNMYNNPNIQENSLTANLMIGNCGGDALSYDELVYQAIYSETDNSLTFVHTKPLTVGETYNDKAITAVYAGFETAKYTSKNNVPWYKDGNYQNIETVNFDSVIKPKSTAYWFFGFSNLVDIDVSKLDTSNVTNMSLMFGDCSSLVELDLSNFNTSKVTVMNGSNNVQGPGGMFGGCSSLTSLDLSNFDTSNLTSFIWMFYNCSSLVELDLSNFDTSSAIYMGGMFRGCSSLTELDLSNFDTSKVTNMGDFYPGGMFQDCSSLTSLDLSNFDTLNVTTMWSMFNRCSSLTELDVSNFNTSKVTTMRGMFCGCSSLGKLDISNFDTSNVVDFGINRDLSIFGGCRILITEITIMNTETTSYGGMLSNAAITKDSDGNYIGHIIINYVPDNPNTLDVNESTEELVDAMIATGNGNIEKGCYGEYCPIET